MIKKSNYLEGMFGLNNSVACIFEVTENKIIQLGNSGNDDTELPNNQQDIQLVEDGIVVTYLGKKVFDVTSSKPYTITVTNVDDKPAHFEAQVVNR